ncbi:MAG TPA: hypothetical protein VNX46_12480, partial [Candidatus Acidoferrum sp.]|nr:hypothetical protein [Candidatus Acidoferrum sp.]
MMRNKLVRASATGLMLSLGIRGAAAQESSPSGSPTTNSPLLFARVDAPTGPVPITGLGQTNGPDSSSDGQTWNWHVQNTDIVQGDPGFPAKYSGPASLNSQGEVRETVTLDLFAGLRLWRGAEAHLDGLMWQGFGLSQTHGIEAFPNG